MPSGALPAITDKSYAVPVISSPLAVAALVRGTRETHAGRSEGGLDAGGAAGLDDDRVAHLEHFEGRGDLVEAEGLAVGAVVVHGQLEGRVVAGGEGGATGGVVVVVVVGVRERVGDCLREGGEGGRGDGEGVHRDAWVVCLVERVFVWLRLMSSVLLLLLKDSGRKNDISSVKE
ncbi:hypothetical protein LTR35_012913 [Friedmanniomyces endolithicus]|uniref:Uncharacterized protein n=1 Tax=Friedmanniomyces endolithicus TaxID=329885 RepID=A0AAN6FN44_9PEZI|nr:hypothetical protein LTR35_012913 [Friedmanniomyces endolithicus]KAK0285472.1 hypothetical protein LTS00_010833 [Friedmanniomyces endolithicus]KAK0321434.1 hypothetical protein LTR82_007402 [Friedmanniomyces endolithicus]KAK0986940.1 hypothetical protein LTR54_013324 [Friedmanniomyces endolithicus]